MFRPRLMLTLTLALMPIGSVVAQPATPGMSQDRMAAPADPSGPADRAMMAGMQRMSQAMDDAPMTGDPDRDFVAMMMPHHQGAIDMARVELQYGRDPGLRRLAHAIVAAQDRELDEMRRWQAKHPAP